MLQLQPTIPATMWQGCVLATIAHAIFIARAPFLAHQNSWDGNVYCAQNSQGARGAVVFGPDKQCFVALIGDTKCLRAMSIETPIDAATIAKSTLAPMPRVLNPLLEIGKRYVLDSVDGSVVPFITCAFWSSSAASGIEAAEPWDDVMVNGGELLAKQTQTLALATSRWVEDCEFNGSEADLLCRLLQKRLTAPGRIRLAEHELALLRCQARGDGGMEASKAAFAQIDVSFD